MGIKNLNTLIETYSKNGKTTKHLSEFSGKTLAIDTNVYLYKFLYGKSNHIDGIFFMINKFKKFNILPIFVFDGKPPNEKKDTIHNRKLIKIKMHDRINELKLKLHDVENDAQRIELQDEIYNIEKKIIYVNKVVIDKTKELFDLMGIIYIDADCEAEHYCSKLCNLELVNGVVSEDMDTIACGSALVIRNFTNKDDYIEAYYIDEILYDLELNYNSFIDLCILLGNDYNNRPRNYSPDEIYQSIIQYKTIENVLHHKQIKGWSYNFNNIRNIIKLKDIYVDANKILLQYNKKPNLTMLKLFLKTFSTIDEKTYLHRIHLIYYQNNKFKCKFNKYLVQLNSNKRNDCVMEQKINKHL